MHFFINIIRSFLGRDHVADSHNKVLSICGLIGPLHSLIHLAISECNTDVAYRLEKTGRSAVVGKERHASV